MVDDTFYAAMKPGALLINIARGGLLHYDATLRARQPPTNPPSTA